MEKITSEEFLNNLMETGKYHTPGIYQGPEWVYVSTGLYFQAGKTIDEALGRIDKEIQELLIRLSKEHTDLIKQVHTTAKERKTECLISNCYLCKNGI